MNLVKRIYLLGIMAENEEESLTYENRRFQKEKDILLWRYSMKNVVDHIKPDNIVAYMDSYQYLHDAENMIEIVEGCVALHDILEL